MFSSRIVSNEYFKNYYNCGNDFTNTGLKCEKEKCVKF